MKLVCDCLVSDEKLPTQGIERLHCIVLLAVAIEALDRERYESGSVATRQGAKAPSENCFVQYPLGHVGYLPRVRVDWIPSKLQ